MKLIPTAKHRREFHVLVSTRSAQAAMMTLPPGRSTSDEQKNEHPWAEQWLFVISGIGRARVGKRSVKLRANDLLLIERREPHQIKNTGRRALVTLNFYVPPAYTKKSELKPQVNTDEHR